MRRYIRYPLRIIKKIYLRIKGRKNRIAPETLKQDDLFSLRHLYANQIQFELPRKRVLMVVLNKVTNDGRVTKTIKTLVNSGYSVAVCGYDNKLYKIKKFSYCGASIFLFPNPSKLLPNRKVSAFNWEHMLSFLKVAMWPVVESFEPHYIHTHDYNTISIGKSFVSELRSRGAKVFWVHDFHEYIKGYIHLNSHIKKLALSWEESSIKEMDSCLTVSPLISEWLSKDHALKRKPSVVLNTPLESSLCSNVEKDIRSELSLKKSTPLVVYTGVVNELRGLDVVLEAMVNEKWHFAIVTNSQGPYVEFLKKRSEVDFLKNRVHFLPYVQSHLVSSYVRTADLGIMPFKRYGNTDASLPTKLFDYLHAGLPVVSSNCTLLEKFLNERKFGKTFLEEDSKSCRKAVNNVLSNAAIFKDKIKNEKTYLNTLTWEEESLKILNIYDGFKAQNSEFSVTN